MIGPNRLSNIVVIFCIAMVNCRAALFFKNVLCIIDIGGYFGLREQHKQGTCSVFKGVVPFLVADLFPILLLIVFPSLSLLLPNMM